MTKFRFNSLSSRISLSFFLLSLALLAILFLQIIPNLQEKEKKYIIEQIENVLFLTNQQLKLADKSIKNSGVSRREELKSIMESEANRILKNISNSQTLDLKDKNNYFTSKKIQCSTSFLDNNLNTLFQTKKESLEDIKDELQENYFLRKDTQTQYVCPVSIRHYHYTKAIPNSDKKLVLSCNIDKFRTKSQGLEKSLKNSIQESFSKLDSLHKGKTYIMWLNSKRVNESTKNIALLQKGDDPLYNEKYCLSRISSFEFPKTGNLSANEILEAINKEPIKHILDNKETLTWVKQINEKEGYKFLYITSIYKKDLFNNIDSPLLKILPAAIISLIIAIALGLILFRRLFKTMHTLNKTAALVNSGDLKQRVDIKGSDDIAVLANTFNKMLDFIEKNIEELDEKVEHKTKLLSDSLNEKETLLKEIHHRVKNNLAITINLIKLEKAKIEDEKTKESLVSIQERVHAMELLHRKLYESKDLNLIPLKKYLEELCFDLKYSYDYDNKVKLNCFIDDINISIDYALPLGIITTELITNSFKYAFINEGEIELFLSKKDKTCELIFKDNGKGLDESIDINNTQSLGLQIISNLTIAQLFGTFEYVYEKGSKFIIKFEMEE